MFLKLKKIRNLINKNSLKALYVFQTLKTITKSDTISLVVKQVIKAINILLSLKYNNNNCNNHNKTSKRKNQAYNE